MRTKLKRSITKIILVSVVAGYAAAAIATSVPNTSSNPKTFLGPTGHLSVTKSISDNTAFSVLGEGGPRNWRLGGTLAWEIDYYQRIKTSLEYLNQKITYSFFDGRTNQWVKQGALGVDYQYDFHETAPYNTQLDLAAYVSRAPSKTLHTDTGAYLNDGVFTPYILLRRIAGSTAGGVSPGLTFSPWYGTSAKLQLNYDDVHYDTKFERSKNAIGLGGTVGINQMIVEDVNLGLSAAVRKPFNNYQADLSFGNVPFHGIWIFKVFGIYTIGKNTLPTTYNVGVGADYLIDADNRLPPPVNTSDMYRSSSQRSINEASPGVVATTSSQSTKTSSTPDFKGEAKRQYKDRVYKDTVVPPVEWQETDNVNKDLLMWTAIPAVYMPQVLAIPEDKNECPFGAPVLLADIPGSGPMFPFILNVAPFFSGQGLTYTLNALSPPPASTTATISGSVITFTGIDGDVTVSVTASNMCGSVTSNPFTITS